jgi:hypothetical protein
MAALWFGRTRPNDQGPGGGDSPAPNVPTVDASANAAGPLGPDAPPLPSVLRNRVINHRILLLRENFEPVWSCRLAGTGNYQLLPDSLALTSVSDECWTLLALDADPEKRWFEFDVELRQTSRRQAGKLNLLGLFFGYRRNPDDPTRRYPFFALELEEWPGIAGAPQATVGWSNVDEARGLKGDATKWCVKLPGTSGVVNLPPLDPSGWRKVQVRAVDGSVDFTIDQKKVASLDLRRLTAAGSTVPHLDPRGALGIWTRDGIATFRNASVVTLVPDR